MVHCRYLWALAQLLLVRLDLVGGVGVPRLSSGGGGGGAECILGSESFCFKTGGPCFSKKEDDGKR